MRSARPRGLLNHSAGTAMLGTQRAHVADSAPRRFECPVSRPERAMQNVGNLALDGVLLHGLLRDDFLSSFEVDRVLRTFRGRRPGRHEVDKLRAGVLGCQVFVDAEAGVRRVKTASPTRDKRAVRGHLVHIADPPVSAGAAWPDEPVRIKSRRREPQVTDARRLVYRVARCKGIGQKAVVRAMKFQAALVVVTVPLNGVHLDVRALLGRPVSAVEIPLRVIRVARWQRGSRHLAVRGWRPERRGWKRAARRRVMRRWRRKFGPAWGFELVRCEGRARHPDRHENSDQANPEPRTNRP